MKHTVVRLALFALELLAALGAVAGGLALLAGIIRLPLEQLQGTPFGDYTIPGLILASDSPPSSGWASTASSTFQAGRYVTPDRGAGEL